MLVHLDHHRHLLRIEYATFTVGGPQMDLEDGAAIETFAHEATHVRLNSFDESDVQCANYRHRPMALRAFASVGVRFPQWLEPQILFGLRWLHEHLAKQYLIDC